MCEQPHRFLQQKNIVFNRFLERFDDSVGFYCAKKTNNRKRYKKALYQFSDTMSFCFAPEDFREVLTCA
jgi:hypothetical protein